MPDRPLPRCAWLRLTWAFQVAVSPACLVLATAGLLTTNLVQLGLDRTLPSAEPTAESRQLSTMPFVHELLQQQVGVDGTKLPLDPVLGVPLHIASPAARLFRTNESWTSTVRHLVDILSNVLVWSFFGLAIVRIAILECGQRNRISLRLALRFAARKWLQVAGAPCVVILAIMLIAIPVFAMSWLIRFEFGMLLVGACWIIVLAFAGMMTVLAVGLASGWPLMWGAIAAEDSDLFDAVSRSFAYTFQRPGHYLAYLSLACLIGISGWLVAAMAAETVVELAYWSIQVGGGADRTAQLRKMVENPAGSYSGLFHGMSAGLVRTANRIPSLIAAAFSFSFFWSAMGVIYLLLRFDTDQTAFEDIIQGESDQSSAGAATVAAPPV